MPQRTCAFLYLAQVELEGAPLSSLLWAFASWGFYDGPLLQALGAKAARAVKHLQPDELARVRARGVRVDSLEATS